MEVGCPAPLGAGRCALVLQLPDHAFGVGHSLPVGFDPGQTPHAEQGKIQIPWFIGLFLLASVARSFVPGIVAATPLVSRLATAGLTLTLFLIGAGISMKTLRAVGWKPLLQGVILWLLISAGSLEVILRTVA